MNGEDRLITTSALPDDDLDRSIRPRQLADYVGQAAVKRQMQVFIAAARQR
ncbi:MAG: Holliday junction branch migration DNA helicase RuvB, partial [Gammaproteobacteria bacterium PRO9]|nr:Holliday junction branch migration DNA helicase RuvB [Gammaproteobacteria bacterium PRO9]